MTRDIVVGNGKFLAAFDACYQLRELYFPRIGDRNRIGTSGSRFILASGDKVAATTASSFRIRIKYLKETLCTSVSLANNQLQVVMHCCDAVDYQLPMLIRRIRVRNLVDYTRTISIYHHQNFHVADDASVSGQSTYDKATQSVVHHAGSRSLSVTFWNAFEPVVVGHDFNLPPELHEALAVPDPEPTRTELFDQSQSFIKAQLRLDGFQESDLYLVIIAAESDEELARCRKALETIGPEELVNRTAAYWRQWVTATDTNFGHLPGRVQDLFNRSLLLIRSHTSSGGTILTDFGPDAQTPARRGYTRVATASLAALAMDIAGQSEAVRGFYQTIRASFVEHGALADYCTADGSPMETLASTPAAMTTPSLIEGGLLLRVLWRHYHRYRDTEFFRTLWPELIAPLAQQLAGLIDPVTALPPVSLNLWRNQVGVDLFTVCSLYAGLTAAQRFAACFADAALATRLSVLAEKVKNAIERRFFSQELNRFVRALLPTASAEVFTQDQTLDSSIFAVAKFGVLPPDDPRMVSTATILADRLWVKTPVGGLARFEGDVLDGSSSVGSSGAVGVPSFTATLWLAQYLTSKAKTVDELKQAIPLLEWVVANAGGTGFLGERIGPEEPASAASQPAIGSHAQFVLAVAAYLEKLQQLHPCQTCGQPVYQRIRSVVDESHDHDLPTPGVEADPAESPLEAIVSFMQSNCQATITLDLRECLGCGACTLNCRQGAIHLRRHKVQVNREYLSRCDLCMNCENACPTGAIHVLVSDPEVERQINEDQTDSATDNPESSR